MCLRVCDLYCMFVRFVLCGNNDREDSRQNRGEFRETKGLDMLSKWSAGEGEEDKTGKSYQDTHERWSQVFMEYDRNKGEDRKRLHGKRMKNKKKLEKCMLTYLNSNVSFYDLNLQTFFFFKFGNNHCHICLFRNL